MLKKNENIKETVKKAASELTSVNEVLQQEDVPVQVMKQALTQNEGVEQKVAKAADGLMYEYHSDVFGYDIRPFGEPQIAPAQGAGG